ncbi:helix-turn-helix domain-containing protein [Saccharopolyspora hordei]|uniref:Transcriptional regulator with XRE-family HTH domain n=1 Tax=Saccharopolyspora hordei TaxID=1838 RepID=A0A853AC91_9PSEU|nr:helix-turn-helix transcriptional regulator [Saccharopolyspora hordei]NYI82052.1 transcriptional regulator with XRE-family HTH domain [Saccharopolyspora hordei]
MRLREAREEVGLTGVTAAKELGISQNFLSEVEHGKRRLTADKLAEAASLYEVHEDELFELQELRRGTDERGWWTQYSGLFPPELLRYFGYEWGAESIRMHESLLIPGLLQTEAYAHAIVTSDSPNTRTSEADQRVEARMLRQRRLRGEDPLRLTVVLSEGALHQQVGGPTVLAEQLEHLLALIEELPDTLELLVVPFTAGAHGALGASTFHILSFPSPRLPDLVWQETLTWLGVIADRARTREYAATFAQCLRKTAGRRGSRDMVHRALREIA